ncbi:FAD-dependent monooxygenase [Kitasatospora cineracea]|uniref:2-polyprenyl-6-methoxyphenol hydroxylase-like FAD-dependent oxidoreductase n=1 Tax=Kitasatospora cineracea TaxID=88074 RepID=A0A3N4R7I1_9ACTN|nr:FAD-dependent monooxygenase [Kitasatospora cineracea]RPE26935.1 2-polyprenyl-6-methoxyphenol hydroxylase-like FAD-dependent oxidoreductase [Kitasatospora cineracea]
MAKGAIIVGAGPVGLMLAGELRLGGADVVVFEKLPAPSGESRGVGFTRRAAEVFDQRGLLERFGDVEWAQGHFGGVRIDFSKLDDNHFSVRGIPQFRTEEILESWLKELGVEVRREHEVLGFRETGDGVTVEYRGPDGPGEESAQYLVGCDGARSIVRRLAGIDFPGWEPTRGMYMADVVGANVRQRPIGERVPGGMVMAFNLENGVDRIVIHNEALRPPEDKSGLTFATIADAWQEMTGESLHHAEVRWVSSFTDTTRQAAEYRRGRVFLAGDATHIHMPAGAQGMSVGVQDAANLGWKLAAAINGRAPEGLLDTFQSERHPVGELLMRNTRAQTKLYLSGEEMEPLRAVLQELVQDPAVARHLAGQVSGLDVRYDMGAGSHPQLGLRLRPDIRLKLADGSPATVRDLLKPARGVLLVTSAAADADGLRATAAPWADRVDVTAADWAEGGADRPDAPAALLVRPDGYVAWVQPDDAPLRAALERWFGAA